MFDIRDHGGNFNGGSGGLNKFPLATAPTNVLLTKALSSESYQLDVSKYISQYPTAAYSMVTWNASSPKIDKKFYTISDVYLGYKAMATLPVNISSLTLLDDGYHALEQATTSKRYIIKNDVISKQYTLSYLQYLLYSDGTYIIAFDSNTLYVYKDSVLVKSVGGYPGVNYVALQVAKDAVLLVTNLSYSNVGFLILLRNTVEIVRSDGAVNSATSLKLATSKIAGGNF